MGYIGKMTDTSGTTHLVASTLYGTCSTAAATAAKVVTCADFDVEVVDSVPQIPTGLTIKVKFTNTNTKASPTLNINSKGAVNIYRYGTTASGTTAAIWWAAGSIVSFTYDGTAWIIDSYKEGDVNHNTDAKTSSSNSTSQLYLIGATSQSTSGVSTYSNTGLYATNGKLYSAGIENSGQIHSANSIYVGESILDATNRGIYVGTSDNSVRIASIEFISTGRIVHIGEYGSTSSIQLHGGTVVLGSDSSVSPTSSSLVVDGDYLDISKQTRTHGNIIGYNNFVANQDNTTMGSSNYGYRVFDGVDVLNLAMYRRNSSSSPVSRFTFAAVVPNTNSTWGNPYNEVIIGNTSTNDYTFTGIVQTSYGTVSGSALYINSSGKIGKSSSTRRVKTDINYLESWDLESYHNKVMQLKPATYRLKADLNTQELGLIAEDVYDVCNIAAIEETQPIYNMTAEEASKLQEEQEVIGFEKTGEIENYKDRAILAMLIADNQYKDSQIEALKEQVANLSELVNSLIEKQDSNSSLWE